MPYYISMKSQSNRPDISEMPPYRLGRHWNTIQAYLIPGLEDDIGELSEELKKFMGICELLIDEKMFAKYRWCGNGRPPRTTWARSSSHTPHDITLVFLSQRYFVNGVCFSPLAVLTTSRSVFHGSTSFSHGRR